MKAARADYFADNGFSEAQYHDRWIKLPVGPLAVYIPNSRSRKRAVRLHDLHHVATGYDTSWRGEAQISAWELGAGCGRYAAAWLLNLAGMALGFVIAPVRTWRAFRRGRRCRALYASGWSDELLTLTVGELRDRLGLRTPLRRSR